REYLVYLLSQDPALKIVGTAKNGLEGVEQAERLKPHLILMDVHMPQMNGFEATREIMSRCPTPIVMVSASMSKDEAALSFEALKAGALMLVDKPAGPDHPEYPETSRRLVEAVKLMAEVKVIRHYSKRQRRSAEPTPVCIGDQKIHIIAIGASAGGPPVLADILERLPREFALPILVVQHIAAGFVAGLVDWLRHQTRLTVKLAERGERVTPGTVYIAPDTLQMGLTKRGTIHLTTEAADDGFRPSVSYLFRSVAESFGPSAVGVLLTGMGRDGAEGLLRLREAGAITIAQNQETSAVFGMPAEAIRLGAAEHVLSPEQIVGAIRSLVGRGR
ncbi:MAG: chemotaxis-specific protein-glutamate methyltransferase CheB, partial [Candidatus Methylomirabilales bacterium]